MKKNIEYLISKKNRHEKITMLSCYDYPTTLWAEEAEIDIVLVGDSVGVKLLGYENPNQVTMDDMFHHFKAVQRAINDSYLIADLPLSSCKSKELALDGSRRFIDHGADAVKIENFDVEIAEYLLNNQIEVCFDILYPFVKQHFQKPGRNSIDALVEIICTAIELEKSGVSTVVFTMFPEEAAKLASELLKIPTIGVGSGRFTDGQVLIAAEMLGITDAMGDGAYNFRYDSFADKARNAIRRFARETITGEFPTEANYNNLEESQYDILRNAMKKKKEFIDI